MVWGNWKRVGVWILKFRIKGTANWVRVKRRGDMWCGVIRSGSGYGYWNLGKRGRGIG